MPVPGDRVGGRSPRRCRLEPLAAFLAEITEQPTATTADAPLAALRAVGVLERVVARVSREAASMLCDDGASAETVATGLGTTHSKDLFLLLTAQDR
ncbi:hypothetical protein B6R96_36425 (plasmid) [Streptomyces sp. Sge12]|uniref:hypothetical protein n=1 Tax=Streptomyces sp. Sge12 TaxID=1972846 RepID=UPI0009C2087E|nr:hypothetical protein [Streptomyces sp. Sge12]ARE79501.1 hypothetical protein B6R96_36425 [Streptomyces sp. Sge12]